MTYHATDADDDGTVEADIDANTIENTDYHEAVDTNTVSGTVGLDISTANLFQRTLSGDTTFEFNNPSTSPAGNSFTVLVKQDGSTQYTITWPTSVEWDSGTTPNDPATGEEIEVVFISYDGGTSWKGRKSWGSA